MLLSLFLALLMPALQPEGLPLSQPSTEEPTPEWHRGPIHYILALKEEEAYRRIKTAEARWRFIEEFWSALDPTPDTPENERRAEFWLRVERADLLFGESNRPGWRTDRGQVYVLLGTPDHLKRFPWGDSWSYEAVPPPDAQPAIGFAFFRAPGGEYSLHPPPASLSDRRKTTDRTSRDLPRLSERVVDRTPRRNLDKDLCPSDGSPYNRWLPPVSHDRPTTLPRYRSDATPVGNGRLAAQAAAIQGIPGRIRLPGGSASSDYFFGNLQAAPSLQFTGAAAAKTHAVLTLAVPSQQFREPGKPIRVPDLVFAVSIQETAGGRVIARLRRRMSPDPSWKESSGEEMRFRTAFELSPGTYRAEGTVIDERSHLGSIYRAEFIVPDFGTPAPASSAGPAPGSAPPGTLPPPP